GIKFSKTACFPTGRLARSAIALAVCDLPAARHLASLAGTGSHFYCSTCNCYHKTTYGRVDFDSWKPRDKDELRKFAEQWRDAATTSEREKLFKAHGVRYSELWRLPYWDPSRQLVIDPMHCILEGLVQHHSRSLLGLTTTTTSSSSASSSSPPAFSCDLGEMPPGMTSKELTQVAAIHTFLVTQVPSDDEDLEKLKKNLSHKNTGPLKFEITIPSWFTSAPSDFGSASAGTMKADEWRSLITVYIPIALVSLWGAGTSHPSDEVGTRHRAILDHTMELVCAVYLACARSTSAERAHAYHSHIARYVGNLKKIHPTFALRPNHHAAFHIYDFLLLFGPAHSWWCFPFERLIGILQRLPVNHKIGVCLRSLIYSSKTDFSRRVGSYHVIFFHQDFKTSLLA
ncbi:hypothetical protein P692DRAFT_201727802, partial [Suillus brevipes Sb2]